MRTIALLLALSVLAACDSASTAREVPRERPEPVPPNAAKPEPDVSGAFSIEEENERFSFAFAWPAEISAIPALEARLRQRMEEAKAALARTAAEAHADAAANDYPFRAHHHGEAWAVLGDSGRLLALAAEIATYSGGAHGNFNYDALLWDRQANAPLETAALFEGGLDRFRPRFCAALNAERSKRRGEPVAGTGEDDFATGCPALAELDLLPADTDEDGRFDTLRVLIPPYVAGPYAEGTYEIDLDLREDEDDAAGIDPAFRGAFEA